MCFLQFYMEKAIMRLKVYNLKIAYFNIAIEVE